MRRIRRSSIATRSDSPIATLHERSTGSPAGSRALGVKPGDTVGVLDWDTHRFLEAFFAIPMMGAVLQTVNVRLSHEQVLYTIEHAGATTLLVNVEFRELLAAIRPRLTKVEDGRHACPTARRRAAHESERRRAL